MSGLYLQKVDGKFKKELLAVTYAYETAKKLGFSTQLFLLSESLQMMLLT